MGNWNSNWLSLYAKYVFLIGSWKSDTLQLWAEKNHAYVSKRMILGTNGGSFIVHWAIFWTHFRLVQVSISVKNTAWILLTNKFMNYIKILSTDFNRRVFHSTATINYKSENDLLVFFALLADLIVCFECVFLETHFTKWIHLRIILSQLMRTSWYILYCIKIKSVLMRIKMGSQIKVYTNK